MVGRRLRQLTYGLRLGPFRETYARSGATISNQILRHEGELPPEIGGIERRAGGRGDAGRFKMRFERIASVSRPRLRRLAWSHGAQTQTPSRSRVCPGRERSISPARSTTPAGSKFGDGSLRRALYDAAQIILTKPLKGCSQPKSRPMRIAKCAGMSKAKVGLARRPLPKERSSTLEQSDRRRAAVRAGHDTRPSRAKCLRRDDGSR